MPLLSKRIKELRENMGWTQQQLADLLKTSQPNIANYEKNIDVISIETLEKLSSISNYSVDYLLGLTDIKHKIDNIINFNNVVHVPILGTIKDGQPILAQEHVESYIPFVDTFLPYKDCCFVLKVSGDSMIDANINHGDLLLCKKQSCIDNNGDIMIVIVNSDNEATVKRIYKEDDGLILQPENKNYKPIFIPKQKCEDVIILGKVINKIFTPIV